MIELNIGEQHVDAVGDTIQSQRTVDATGFEDAAAGLAKKLSDVDPNGDLVLNDEDGKVSLPLRSARVGSPPNLKWRGLQKDLQKLSLRHSAFAPAGLRVGQPMPQRYGSGHSRFICRVVKCCGCSASQQLTFLKPEFLSAACAR
jgi:hypothetical protein